MKIRSGVVAGLWVLQMVAVLPVVGCGAEGVSESDFEVTTQDSTREQAFTQGPGPLRGHEDVVRFGVTFANGLVQQELGIADFFPAVPEGDMCDSAHAIVQGSCATDTPDATMTQTYGVPASEWQTAGNVQDLHFLRDYKGAGVYGSKASCLRSRARIVEATSRALKEFAQGNIDVGNYWLGHAVHTIQDSFSPAHSVRTGPLLRTLTDVCTYGRTVGGVCSHSTIDWRDRVWRMTLSCQMNPYDRAWTCLVPQAQSAAYATAGYLRAVARHRVVGEADDMNARLNKYFDITTDSYDGYLNCSTLR